MKRGTTIGLLVAALLVIVGTILLAVLLPRAASTILTEGQCGNVVMSKTACIAAGKEANLIFEEENVEKVPPHVRPGGCYLHGNKLWFNAFSSDPCTEERPCICKGASPLRNNGTCGTSQITSLEECNKAISKTAGIVPEHTGPPLGCYYKVAEQKLYWHELLDGTSPCTAARHCICEEGGILTEGQCTNVVTTMTACIAAGKVANLTFEEDNVEKVPPHVRPRGCYLHHNKLWFNGFSSAPCTEERPCICKGASPLRNNGTCGASQITSSEECNKAINKTAGIVPEHTGPPLGCYYKVEEQKLFWHELLDGKSPCTAERNCICAGEERMLTSGTCEHPMSSANDCSATILAKKLNAPSTDPIDLPSDHSHRSGKPGGCYLSVSSRLLVWNEDTKSTFECSKERKCICADIGNQV